MTVLVPTRNEAHNIERFLASLPAAVSLVVVDSSTDETPNLIARLRPWRTQTLRERCNVTQARQLGAAHAQSAWLLFTDADVTFAPDYFQRLASLDVSDARLGVIFGAKDTSDGQYALYHRAFALGQRSLSWFGIPAASGSNLLVRRDAFERVGGFDLRLTCNEDSEIAWRVVRAGYRARFVPALRVYAHDHRRLRKGAARKMLHSVARCALLYLNLMPARWRTSDWGYWSSSSG